MDYHRKTLLQDEQDQRDTVQHKRTYLSFAGAGDPTGTDGLLNHYRPNMWWDEERVEATVDRDYVLAQLITPEERNRLDDKVAFGSSLTDSTYFNWIETKAKRLFLILVELGLPEQIFGVIDDSWDDDDLPIPLEQVDRLQLTYNRNLKVEKRFYYKQFHFLLRSLDKGDHLMFDEFEIIPLEPASRRAVNAVLQTNVDKVNLPGRPDDIFLRRRVPLGTTGGSIKQEDFLSKIRKLKGVEYRHLTNIWASYQHQDNAYLLLHPVFDSNLKSFLTTTPQSFKIKPKSERRVLLLSWLCCLAEALSFLHSKEVSHGNIKPSNIMLDEDNGIYFGETSMIPECTTSGEKKGFEQEAYIYSAPEERQLPAASAPQIIRKTARKSLINTKSSVSPTSPTFPELEGIFMPKSPPPSPENIVRFDPRMADIFSLGAIFVEILTCLMKRTSKQFSNLRASKNKTAGRGGGPPDSSFHKNRPQVMQWLDTLVKEASKKEDKIFRGVQQVLILALDMLDPVPTQRPSATEVCERLKISLLTTSGIPVEDLHCLGHRAEQLDAGLGFDQLRLASQKSAAEACALSAATGMPVIGSTPPVMTNDMIYEQTGVRRSRNQSEYQMTRANDGARSSEHDRRSTSNKSSSNKDNRSTTSGRDNRKSRGSKPAWQAPTYADFTFG
ncbi:protein kinase [Phlyctema vagabunda]|uniref:Protein kinase n=1 Tax=Phlyctema vagabunda TaxID=108571 RepID=A0ABR4PXU2_9HELO